jgi:arginyl-tRNA synthetase
MKAFYEKLTETLQSLIKKEYQIDLELPLWELPSKQEFGDLSSMAAMKLAAPLKKNPLEIAERLKSLLEKELAGDVEKIEILKPAFINIFLSRKILLESLASILTVGEDFFRHKGNKKVLVEFCSANPTGPISIAHGRQAVVGDVIAGILNFCGNQAVKEYYVNDAGNQLNLLAQSLLERAKEIRGEPFAIPEGGYQGEYVKDMARAWMSDQSRDPKTFAIQYALEMIKTGLKSLGVEYDVWTSQQKIIDDKKVEAVLKILEEKGLMFNQEDALWLATSKFGDDKDRVIRKADGELTYFASDIALHKDKFDRGFERLVNLWGPDHHGYIPRVQAAMKALGYPQNCLEVIIIQLVTLKTKEKMSKRKGTAILVTDLVEEVGKDAARFYYLTRKNSSHLEFDIDLAKELSVNNPLYYIQYSCARIESLFTKLGVKEADVKYDQYLNDPEEMILLRTILQFAYCLEKAAYSCEPVFVVEYLKALAAAFHRFYEKKRLMGEEENILRARANLLFATRAIFYCGLKLIGIEPVKKM